MTDGLHIPSTTTTTAAHHSSSPEADVGVSDLLFLEPLTEQSFIDNLRRRFHADKIYVSILAQPPRVASGGYATHGISI